MTFFIMKQFQNKNLIISLRSCKINIKVSKLPNVKKKTFFNYEIKMEIKTATTTALKNELKYSPMSEGNTSIAEPNLEVSYP